MYFFDNLVTAAAALVKKPAKSRFHLCRWWGVAADAVYLFTKEVVFHLTGDVFARARIGQAQAVFIDEHGLVAQPATPSFL